MNVLRGILIDIGALGLWCGFMWLLLKLGDCLALWDQRRVWERAQREALREMREGR
jgi:hypothetical protein